MYLFNRGCFINVITRREKAELTFDHFFLPAAFCADFVALPSSPVFFSTPLITPTATVCFMSLTANRPRGGYSEYVSTHIGLLGSMRTIDASPDFTIFGLSSNFLPDRRSIFSMSSLNLQAICAVWQSRTGAYPAWISPG